jgi:hypothetical protein
MGLYEACRGIPMERIMNAMQIASASYPKTIGELKEYISNMEKSWSEEDTHYLGKFNDQKLYIDTGKGIAQGFVQYYGEFGFITFQE